MRRKRHASEYASWVVMRQRCRTRGIPVARRWESFKAFFRDLGPRPRGYALIRKSPDASFAPGSCSWRPRAERQRCRRRNRLTARDAQRIREKHDRGAGRADLTRLYGVSLQHVCLIVAGARWKPGPRRRSHAR